MKKLLSLVVLVMFSLTTVIAQDKPDQRLQCKGKTKAGDACKSTIVSKKTGYCNAHDPNRPHCTGKNSKGEPCGMIVSKGKTTCRFHSVQ
jgi:hypothetical protein